MPKSYHRFTASHPFWFGFQGYQTRKSLGFEAFRHSHHWLWDYGNLIWHRTGDLLATFDALNVLAIGSEWSQNEASGCPWDGCLCCRPLKIDQNIPKTNLKIEWTGGGKSYEVIRDRSRLCCWPARQLVLYVSTSILYASHSKSVLSVSLVCRSRPCHSYDLGE